MSQQNQGGRSGGYQIPGQTSGTGSYQPGGYSGGQGHGGQRGDYGGGSSYAYGGQGMQGSGDMYASGGQQGGAHPAAQHMPNNRQNNTTGGAGAHAAHSTHNAHSSQSPNMPASRQTVLLNLYNTHTHAPPRQNKFPARAEPMHTLTHTTTTHSRGHYTHITHHLLCYMSDCTRGRHERGRLA